MSIDSLSKDSVNKLLLPLVKTELDNDKIIKKLQSNATAYSQLKLLAQQVKAIEQQAMGIINNAIENDSLYEIECQCKKIPGKSYYLYQNADKKYFSMLSPKDWKFNHKDPFLGEYYYDFDYTFNKIISHV